MKLIERHLFREVMIEPLQDTHNLILDVLGLDADMCDS